MEYGIWLVGICRRSLETRSRALVESAFLRSIDGDGGSETFTAISCFDLGRYSSNDHLVRCKHSRSRLYGYPAIFSCLHHHVSPVFIAGARIVLSILVHDIPPLLQTGSQSPNVLRPTMLRTDASTALFLCHQASRACSEAMRCR